MTVYRAAHRQGGFTLIELMIALVLGLLISAAVLQVFLTSSQNSRRQQASSQLQDNAVFGFSQLQQHIRRANYGARPASTTQNEYFLNHLTPQGGIVLTAPAASTGTPVSWLNGNLSGLVLDGNPIPTSLLTSNSASGSRSNLTGIANSDQLTIQYQAGRDGMFDCEGDAIPEGYYVIERYFVRNDTTVTPNAPGLACASAIYQYSDAVAGSPTGIDIREYLRPSQTTATANNLDGDGTIVIPSVDYFRVLLGVSASTGFATFPDTATIAYIPVPALNPTSLNAALNNNRIVSIQIGILARSTDPTVTTQDNTTLRFSILDRHNSSLNTATAAESNKLRNVYDSTILIRNARGGV